MKFVSIPYNDFIYEIFIYEMLCEIFVRAITLWDTEYFTSINGLGFLLNNSNGNTLSCLLLYRKHGGDIQKFIACLHYIITSFDIDVIFVDFNIDYFNE